VAGHITARDPELTDHFWVNPFGMSFRHVRVSDLILVSHTGEVVEGNRPVNPAAFAIHSAVHAARPDVIAAAHAHSVYGKAWSSLGRLARSHHPGRLRLLRGPHRVRGGRRRHRARGGGGQGAGLALGPHKATIHRNHGLFTVGHTVDEAAWWFITMERSCQAQLLAEAAGTPVLIDDEGARYTRDRTASHLAGWFSFQAAVGRDRPAQRPRPLRLTWRWGRRGGPDSPAPTTTERVLTGLPQVLDIAGCDQNENVF
jgi:ribulose-5-phosphate 4-epimerase/fuculose-1-phosphate aldolase